MDRKVTPMAWTWSILNRPLSRKRVLGSFGMCALLVAAGTWGQVPWRWGFVLLWVCAGFVLQLIQRRFHPSSPPGVSAIPGVSAPFVIGWFYGDLPSGNASAHVIALVATGLICGVAVADWTPFGGRSNRPLQPASGGEVGGE